MGAIVNKDKWTNNIWSNKGFVSKILDFEGAHNCLSDSHWQIVAQIVLYTANVKLFVEQPRLDPVW